MFLSLLLLLYVHRLFQQRFPKKEETKEDVTDVKDAFNPLSTLKTVNHSDVP